MNAQNGQLLINGVDAWDTYGIVMGEGFLNALYAPTGMKDYVEGQSRLEHGKRVITANAKVSSRDVTLTFNIHGETEDEFTTHRDAFYTLLYLGTVDLQVVYPDGVRNEIFHLIYKKASTYAQNYRRRICRVAVKFEEPNPMDRE